MNEDKIPRGIYFPSLDPKEVFTWITNSKKLKHVCIDDNPFIELVLRFTLAQKGLYPTQVGEIYAWTALIDGNAEYFFVNKHQHKEMQTLVKLNEQPCEE